MRPDVRTLAAAITTAATLAAATPALAQQGLYGGFGVTEVEFKPDRGPSFRPTALTGLVGKEINANFAAELRLSAGLSKDSNVEVDHVFGAYGRGILPLANQVSLYGLLGVTRSQLNFTGGGGKATDTGLSYGVDIGIGKSAAIGIEWTSLLRPSGYELNALGVLAKFRF